MIVDKEISIVVISSVIIHKLKLLSIESKINDKIILPIDKLWLGSNIPVNVKCDICGSVKKLQFNLYNKNVKKHNIYCCSNKCSNIKNKMIQHIFFGNLREFKGNFIYRFTTRSDVIEETIAKEL